MALNPELIYLRTNKDVFYTDESIELEASWVLDYDEEEENPCFQIKIFDYFNNLIWNSSEFKNKGFFEENWTIKIENLNLNYNNDSNLISIQAIISNDLGGDMSPPQVLDTLYIMILKRNIICELSNFTNYLILGNNLSLIARFYKENTNVSLSGKMIMVWIISSNKETQLGNFTSNYQGCISVNLSSIRDMTIGINYLVFNITEGLIYNQSIFKYQILVEKIPVYIDILRYKKDLGWAENVELELFFYYLDGSVVPLKEKIIEILIYDNYNTNQRIFNFTDEFGMLKINLSAPPCDINHINNKFYIDLIYNGSQLLKEITLVLEFEILTIILPNNDTTIPIIIITMGSILTILIISYISRFRKKNPKFKKVGEICFKF